QRAEALRPEPARYGEGVPGGARDLQQLLHRLRRPQRGGPDPAPALSAERFPVRAELHGVAPRRSYAGLPIASVSVLWCYLEPTGGPVLRELPKPAAAAAAELCATWLSPGTTAGPGPGLWFAELSAAERSPAAAVPRSSARIRARASISCLWTARISAATGGVRARPGVRGVWAGGAAHRRGRYHAPALWPDLHAAGDAAGGAAVAAARVSAVPVADREGRLRSGRRPDRCAGAVCRRAAS